MSAWKTALLPCGAHGCGRLQTRQYVRSTRPLVSKNRSRDYDQHARGLTLVSAGESSSTAGSADVDSSQKMDLYFREARMADLPQINALEAAGYPDDEAATPEDDIVGYVCGTLTSAERLTHDSMSNHEPEGSKLCIHSVCVDERLRRRGIALRSLIAYFDFVRETTPAVTEMRLICKEPLVPLYAKAGFREVGPSPVVHGADPWIEMVAVQRSKREQEVLDRKRRSWYW